MKDLLDADSVSKLIPFCSASVSAIDRESAEDAHLLAEICRDGNQCWLARGGSLEIVDLSTGLRRASWNFGSLLHDSGLTVTCVVQYVFESAMYFVVGLEMSAHAGMLCVFEPQRCKIIRTIVVPFAVTSLETIPETSIPNNVLSEHLQLFNGIVAAGTYLGHVYLVDLCLDEKHFLSDEVNQSHLHMMTVRTLDVSTMRKVAMHNGQHLCLELGDDCHRSNKFLYRKPDSSIMKSLTADAVFVSQVTYIKQAGVLVIGYNFGCFQLWRLGAPLLEFSSKFENDLPPVTHFAYQEPENDPRNYCYLWVANSSIYAGNSMDIPSSLCLYQLAYSSKSWLKKYNFYLYDEFQGCFPRYHFVLTSPPFSQVNDDSSYGTRLISCFTVADKTCEFVQNILGSESAMVGEDDEEQEEEEIRFTDLSLCAFVWEAPPQSADQHSEVIVGLFDMNRWYHSQMPTQLRVGEEECPYIGFFSLGKVLNVAAVDTLLQAYIPAESISRFTSLTSRDQHFHPSSLGFDVYCLVESGILKSNFLGRQRQVLSDMVTTGPSCLVEPENLFDTCSSIGLLSRSYEVPMGINVTVFKRELLLSMAVDYGRVDFIASCIDRCGEGDFVRVGCTLRFLLDWSWKKVASVKRLLDNLCVPLYDWSGIQPDSACAKQLLHCSTAFHDMITIFCKFISHAGPCTEQGNEELHLKLSVVTLLSQHADVVLWFLNRNLLPENDEGEDSRGLCFSYPATALAQVFASRRQVLQKINSCIGETDLLLIDGFIEDIGIPIKNLWSKTKGSGLYPPVSINELLSIYLLEDVSLITKHSIVAYLLLDLAFASSRSNSDTILEDYLSFGKMFNIPCSTMKHVQGFWLLDHRDFHKAIALLLHPYAGLGSLLPWQHTRIVKSLLYQGHSQLALRYLRVAQPVFPKQEDIKLMLNVFLANGLISEAFTYSRGISNEDNCEELLNHFFMACIETKSLYKLLELPFTESEEKRFLEFLQSNVDLVSGDVLVMHYLQRGRYIEALKLNDKLRHNVMAETDPAVREKAAMRNLIVDYYANILPDVQLKLALHPHLLKATPTERQKAVSRPTPLSTAVNHSHLKFVSHAKLISSMLEKVSEVRHSPHMDFTPFRNVKKKKKITSPDMSEHAPPSLPRKDDSFIGLKACKSDSLAESPSVTSLRSSRKTSRTRPSYSPLKKAKELLNQQILSLLQTPPVRRVPRNARTPINGVPEVTPQSILKIHDSFTGYSGSSKTTGVAQRRPCVLKEEEEFIIMSSPSKQLRFDLPDSQPSSPNNLHQRQSEIGLKIKSRPLTPKRSGPVFSVESPEKIDSDTTVETSGEISGVHPTEYNEDEEVFSKQPDDMVIAASENEQVKVNVTEPLGSEQHVGSDLTPKKLLTYSSEFEHDEKMETEDSSDSFHTPRGTVTVDNEVTFKFNDVGQFRSGSGTSLTSVDTADTVPYRHSPVLQLTAQGINTAASDSNLEHCKLSTEAVANTSLGLHSFSLASQCSVSQHSIYMPEANIIVSDVVVRAETSKNETDIATADVVNRISDVSPVHVVSIADVYSANLAVDMCSAGKRQEELSRTWGTTVYYPTVVPSVAISNSPVVGSSFCKAPILSKSSPSSKSPLARPPIRASPHSSDSSLTPPLSVITTAAVSSREVKTTLFEDANARDHGKTSPFAVHRSLDHALEPRFSPSSLATRLLESAPQTGSPDTSVDLVLDRKNDESTHSPTRTFSSSPKSVTATSSPVSSINRSPPKTPDVSVISVQDAPVKENKTILAREHDDIVISLEDMPVSARTRSSFSGSMSPTPIHGTTLRKPEEKESLDDFHFAKPQNVLETLSPRVEELVNMESAVDVPQFVFSPPTRPLTRSVTRKQSMEASRNLSISDTTDESSSSVATISPVRVRRRSARLASATSDDSYPDTSGQEMSADAPSTSLGQQTAGLSPQRTKYNTRSRRTKKAASETVLLLSPILEEMKTTRAGISRNEPLRSVTTSASDSSRSVIQRSKRTRKKTRKILAGKIS